MVLLDWTELAQWALAIATGLRSHQRYEPGHIPGEKSLRLPSDVVPISYDLVITTDLISQAFFGAEDIHLSILNSTSSLTFHVSPTLNISHVALCSSSHHCHQFKEKDVYLLPDVEKITLDLRGIGRVDPGQEWFIRLGWQGLLSDSLAGYSSSPYSYIHSPSPSEVMAVTMFEPVSARRAFPCFDEPALKARFRMTMVSRKETISLSNMPIQDEKSLDGRIQRDSLIALATPSGLKRKHWIVTTFEESPPLSTYTLAFVNGKFKKLTSSYFSKASGKEIPLAVYAGTDDMESSRSTLSLMRSSLPVYESLFDIPFPLPKMDWLSAKAYAGAMEHWGLIIGADSILWLPEQGLLQKMVTVEVVTHELAHQWFGNIVTAEWWDDIWLNEAFATYAADTLLAPRLEPEFDLWLSFVKNDLNPALITDSKRSSHPIHREADSSDDTKTFFDEITYKKGTRVLSTIASIVGQDTFLAGVTKYLKQHLYGSARGEQLWKAISEVSGQDISDIAHSWIYQTGYPVVSVQTAGPHKVKVTQHRFLQSGNVSVTEDDLWPIPLEMLVLKKDGSSLGVTKRILSDRSEIIELGEGDFVKVNHELPGFYRGKYDEDHMSFFKSAMLDDDSSLDGLDAAGIITDLHHVSVAGDADVREVLSLLPSLSSLSQPLLWNSIVDFLSALQGTFWEESEDVQVAIKSYGASIFAPLYDRMGFDSSPEETSETLQLRSTIVKGAVMTGYPPALEQVRARFNDIVWRGKSDAVSPDLRSLVLDYGVALGGKDEWKAMIETHKLGIASNSTLALHAACQTRDAELIAKSLEYIDEERTHPTVKVAGIQALASNPHARRLVASWGIENFQKLRKRFEVHIGASRWVNAIFGGLTSRKDYKKLQKLIDEHPVGNVEGSMRSVLESIEVSYKWLERDRERIVAWLDKGDY